MQKYDYESIDRLYIFFCIMFILTGLTIVASSGNLLILRFVETNTKRTQHERLEMEERRRQQVRVVGDVISSNGRLVTLEDDENTQSSFGLHGAPRVPMNNLTPSDLSLCSCRAQPSLKSCIPLTCKRKFKRKQPSITQNSLISLKNPSTNATRAFHQEILEILQSKIETDEHTALRRSYLQLDRNLKRSSV